MDIRERDNRRFGGVEQRTHRSTLVTLPDVGQSKVEMVSRNLVLGTRRHDRIVLRESAPTVSPVTDASSITIHG